MYSAESYPAPAGFYAADRRRRASREVDIGLWWRGDPGTPTFRAAWVEETGEIYLVQHGPWRNAGRVTVLGRIRDRAALGRRMAGWREVCGREGSLRWLRQRLNASGSGVVDA